MTTAIARVPTPNPSRYLQQVCKHWRHRFKTEFDATHGSIDFEDSQCDLSVDGDHLVARVTAAEADIAEIEEIVAEHIQRFAFREGKLAFDWTREG